MFTVKITPENVEKGHFLVGFLDERADKLASVEVLEAKPSGTNVEFCKNLSSYFCLPQFSGIYHNGKRDVYITLDKDGIIKNIGTD